MMQGIDKYAEGKIITLSHYEKKKKTLKSLTAELPKPPFSMPTTTRHKQLVFRQQSDGDVSRVSRTKYL